MERAFEIMTKTDTATVAEWSGKTRSLIEAALGKGEASLYEQHTPPSYVPQAVAQGIMSKDAGLLATHIDALRSLIERIDTLDIVPGFDPRDWERKTPN